MDLNNLEVQNTLKMKKKLLIYITTVLLFSSCIEQPEKTPDTYMGNFEALWNIVDTKYCYLDYKNINWDSVYYTYEERIDTAMSKTAFFNLLGNMLSELKDGHVNLYSDFNVSRYWKWFSDYPVNFSSSIIYGSRYLGNDYSIAGGMRYKKIRDNVGYIYYGDFSDRFSDKNIKYIFQEFSNCDGLILDVRNNGGGYLDLSEQLASYFFDKDTITGYMSYKIGNGHSDFSEPKAIKTPAHKTIKWNRKVAVLTNRKSYSATNSFVCRMQMAQKARIFGDKTGGGGGLPLSSELPNGWMVRFSACPMFDAQMQHTEWGIDPQVKISIIPEDEAKGIDTIIEKAVEWINQP